MFREYFFNVNGLNFVSSVDVMSPMYQRIKDLPEQLFIEMNINILTQLIKPEYTLADIKAELARVNEGGSYAFIELGQN